MADIWSGRHYYDSDWAEDAADDQFAEDIAAIWEEATGAERKTISKERGKLGIIDKGRRDFTATEYAVLSRIRRAEYERDWRADPTEAPF